MLVDYFRTEEYGDLFYQRSVVMSLRYLARGDFAAGACLSSHDLKTRFKNYQYLWYAAKNAIIKLLKVNSQIICCRLFQFSAQTGPIESCLQAANGWPYPDEVNCNELEVSEERLACFTPGFGPLHLPVHLGAPPCLIDALIDQGLDLEARSKDGRTALHVAAEGEGELDTLNALLVYGSDITVYRTLASVKLLVDCGAETDMVDENALLQCSQDKPDIAQYWVECGVDVPPEDGNFE
ncbi:hypothetical protein B0T10DRAFT_462640 [Thelonectria olida]|uniref:ANK_REP_REGION domain-containing protein n=1 Tax=Thelonectria olida TaxID=1576542 RepID=A0A9P9AMG7_9HYPO|nr:hypothetical protein B0T10DRAFT_462640 [Thelonectria olida]